MLHRVVAAAHVQQLLLGPVKRLLQLALMLLPQRCQLARVLLLLLHVCGVHLLQLQLLLAGMLLVQLLHLGDLLAHHVDLLLPSQLLCLQLPLQLLHSELTATCAAGTCPAEAATCPSWRAALRPVNLGCCCCCWCCRCCFWSIVLLQHAVVISITALQRRAVSAASLLLRPRWRLLSSRRLRWAVAGHCSLLRQLLLLLSLVACGIQQLCVNAG